MIEMHQVTKRYGDFTAVDNVTFTAQPGRVTGFLGPNGAGKSTSMRIMVGLTRPEAGQATIEGRPYQEIPNPGRHVGVLLDASAQHAGRTGREVLKLTALTLGLPFSRVEEMLHLVGLSDKEAKRRVKNYSLGMRQRLGIANALMGDPPILIMDEPANGLDPAGIHWMRGVLATHASRGGTVLLSSHLLHEVEVVADDLVLIGRGKIVAAGPKEELLLAAGTIVAANDTEALAAALRQAGLSFAVGAEGALQVEAEPRQVGQIAAQAQVALLELRPSAAGLEDMFLQLTADDAREQVTDGGSQ